MQNIDYKLIYQLKEKGKQLSPQKVRTQAKEILGKSYCSILSEKLSTSTVTINKAFNSQAPKKLHEINELLNTISKLQYQKEDSFEKA